MTHLTLRQSCPESEAFWSVVCDGLVVGTIADHSDQQSHLSEDVWIWSITVGRPARFIRGGKEPSRAAAMTAFGNAWLGYLALVGEEGWAADVAYKQWMAAMRIWQDEIRNRRCLSDASFPIGDEHSSGQGALEPGCPAPVEAGIREANMPTITIETELDYHRAQARIDELAECGEGTPEEAELLALIDAVEAWEKDGPP
jgi:hypothetical protein